MNEVDRHYNHPWGQLSRELAKCPKCGVTATTQHMNRSNDCFNMLLPVPPRLFNMPPDGDRPAWRTGWTQV